MTSPECDTTFLAGGGEMGALMRACDWKLTPLGDPAVWPQSLRTAVRLILNCAHPMYIWWGPDLLCFYNDAYRQSIGPERHPSSLGQPGREVWDEIWPIIGPQIDQVMAGHGATWNENHLVPITRNGRREDVYWTYSYSPIDDADAPHGVGGVLVVCSETTQKVLSEQRLMQEIESQRRMFQKAPGFIAVLAGPDHVYEYVNDAYEALAGKRRYIGRTVREVLPELEGQGYYELLDHVYTTGERHIARASPVRLETDEKTRYVDFVYEPMLDESDKVFGIFVGGHDITSHRNAESKSLLNEESLRLTTEAAEIGTWDLDIESNTLTWSPRTKAMFGFAPDAVCTLDDFYAGLHPADREATTRAFASALDPDVRATYDVQYRTIGHDDGVIRWVAAKGKGLFDIDGRCYRAVGTAIDISARKLAEARHAFMLELSDAMRGSTDTALNEACALMGRFFGVSRVGYGHLDPVEDVFDYSVCWTDGLAQPLLGRVPAHAFGVKIVNRLSAGETVVVDDLQTDPLSDEEETRATARAVDTRAILVVPFVRAGRLRTIVYLNDRPVRHWQPDEIAFMEEVAERTRQVIERGEAEAALRALNATLEARVEARTAELRATEEALRQSQKMEAIGQLTGGIAHDFNNLLQGITGSLDLVQRRVGQGRLGDLDRFITGAIASANRAAALTHRLLAFSRRQPLDPRPVQINPLVGSMEELLRRTLGERIDLNLRLADGLWLTRCDANQLEAAILNLAINARDAMPAGGQLVIETRNRHTGEAEATAHADRPSGDHVDISVTDTGTGMDTETIARAFEPFFTTKPMGQGTGLGLSMIYGFARQSGGHAWIESTLGRGTTVHLCLPRFEGDADAEETSARTQEASAIETGETVLVIEDEPVVRGLVVEVLGDLGYRAIEAVDGPGGIEIVQSAQRIDLLITDVGLPGLNGRQVADAARALRPDLRVLFMTGYAENAALVFGALDAGMTVITKPFTMDALATRIREIIEA